MNVPVASSYGGVLFDGHGRILLREPTGHFGRYVWTFPKGRPEPGESPQQTALREVLEETGYHARIVGLMPRVFAGTTGTTVMFVMRPVGDRREFEAETSQIRWVNEAEGPLLIAQTLTRAGRFRDLAIWETARQWWATQTVG